MDLSLNSEALGSFQKSCEVMTECFAFEFAQRNALTNQKYL